MDVEHGTWNTQTGGRFEQPLNKNMSISHAALQGREESSIQTPCSTPNSYYQRCCALPGSRKLFLHPPVRHPSRTSIHGSSGAEESFSLKTQQPSAHNNRTHGRRTQHDKFVVPLGRKQPPAFRLQLHTTPFRSCPDFYPLPSSNSGFDDVPRW